MSKSGILGNLDKGMESEKRALDLCGRLLPFMENDEDKADIKKILLDEARHIEITKKLIEIVNIDYNGQDE